MAYKVSLSGYCQSRVGRSSEFLEKEGEEEKRHTNIFSPVRLDSRTTKELLIRANPAATSSHGILSAAQ